MAAMALRLGVVLAKPGVYTLIPGGRAAQAADTAGALNLASKAVLALVLVELTAIIFVA